MWTARAFRSAAVTAVDMKTRWQVVSILAGALPLVAWHVVAR
jgi:hypothetical protein